uniref:30S ribosomal protein S8 n=1 Tax=Cyanidiococcus yangmingshanensis TaxID=2690220 RepID=A0A7G5VUC5_9RHOD|nr:30S ribosomal protein S8 [Cyanidiococcus yangmingshanensis]QMX77292.1 30S ribosomal protein S8 [Cyanidiococcus yangmingshanensis]
MNHILQNFSNHINVMQNLRISNLLTMRSSLVLDLLHLLLKEGLIIKFLVIDHSQILVYLNLKRRFMLKPVYRSNLLKYIKETYVNVIVSTSKGLHIEDYHSFKISDNIKKGKPLLLVLHKKL